MIVPSAIIRRVGICSRRAYLVAMLLVGCSGIVCAQGKADTTTRKASDVMSLRLSAPTIRYSQSPAYGAYARGGSTVIIDGSTSSGVLEISPAVAAAAGRARSTNEMLQTRTIEMRIVGRTIYFDRSVEQFSVVDMTGRRVLVLQNAREASVADLRPGIYFMRCEHHGAATVLKALVR